MEPKKIKVLAIDDNRDNLITLEALIQDSLPGSSVFTATEGNAGIKIAVTEDPDVILLDVIMPGMDGFEVCRELKEDNKLRDIPVVFITALQGDKESRINALEIGAEAFLTKPIDVSELTAQIKAMVKIKRANYDERNEKERLASLVEERTKELKQTHIATLNLLEDLKKENEARRKSEEALRESEERYRQLVNLSPDAIVVHSEGKFIFVNPAAVKLFGGINPEDLLEKPIIEFVHPDFREIVQNRVHQITGGNIVPLIEEKFLQLDGSVIDVEVAAMPLTYKNQPSVQVVFRDISERKRMEIKLRESEAELKEAQRVGRLGSWDWNATTDTITWSEEYYRIYGFDPKLSPPGYEEHLNIYTPESAALLDEVVKKSMQTGEEFQLDLELANAESTTRWVTAHGEVKYDDKGQIVGLRGTAQDITERKLAEEQIQEKDIQFRKLSSNVSGMIFQFTRRLDGTYYVPISSEGIKNIFGCSPEDVQVDFAPISRVIFTEDSARVINDIEYSAKQLTPFTCEFRVQIPGKPIQWIYSKSTPEKLADGSVTWYGFNADITERKRAEEEIIMLANSLRSVNECVSITDLHDRLIFVNDSFLRTYGYEESELIGKQMNIVRSQNNSHELVSKILPATLQGGWQGELLNKRKDGTEFPISLSTTTVKDKKGKTIACIGVASDITNRKHAEEILTNERTLLRTIIDLIPDAVFVKDFEGRKILANKKEIEFSGKNSEDEVIGKTDYDLYPEGEAKRYSDEDQAVLKSGIPLLNLEGKLIDKLGQIHWLIGAKVPLLDMHGQITGLVGVNHDFTERKQFEDELLKLSRAVEQSPASVVITDPEGYIEYVNTKFCEVSGYSKEEVAGKNSKILKSGFHNQEFYAGLWGKILSGKEWSGEFLNKKKNGEQYWESAQISPVINKEGDITHFVAIKEDITEKKKMIQELMFAKDKAEEMSRLKSNFLANMSHELRTPLNGILGYSEILSTSLIDPEQIEMVKGIYQSGKRLSETLKFILDLSEAETGKIEVTAKDISVVPIVKESVLLFTSDAAKKNLKLETTVKDENIMAHLDHILLKRIIHNLIDNAIKFTKEGTINVEVGKEVIKENGKSKKSSALYIKIKDTGIGIPEDKIDLIWEEFRQVSEGISRSYEGPGLGLTISKKAVELMHGTITVESEIGVGSTFTIKFPGILLPSGSIESTADEGEQEESSTKRTKEKNLSASVLYVEDDFINRNMVKLFLKDTCEVDAAEDGTAALKLLKDKKYDLFLVDINLGEGMNGLQLVKEILKIPQYLHTPIVAVTAYAMGKDKEESLQGGCTHYLAKPFRKQEMINLVTDVINVKGE